jgi:predicted MFS family arabinose efflux permease
VTPISKKSVSWLMLAAGIDLFIIFLGTFARDPNIRLLLLYAAVVILILIVMYWLSVWRQIAKKKR